MSRSFIARSKKNLKTFCFAKNHVPRAVSVPVDRRQISPSSPATKCQKWEWIGLTKLRNPSRNRYDIFFHDPLSPFVSSCLMNVEGWSLAGRGIWSGGLALSMERVERIVRRSVWIGFEAVLNLFLCQNLVARLFEILVISLWFDRLRLRFCLERGSDNRQKSMRSIMIFSFSNIWSFLASCISFHYCLTKQ